MTSMHNRLRGVSARRTTAALRLFFLTPAFVGSIFAQAPTLTTIPLPSGVSGPGLFDSAGNLFSFQNGPVTPGTYQTVNGGGQCLFSNGFFSALGPCTDAYVGKIDAGGKLVFGTWIGGNTNDATTALTVDALGNIYLTGTTGGGFPTTANAANASTKAATGFAAKLSPDGSKLLYSTYLPDGDAGPHAIAIDSQGNAYIAGQTATNHAFVVKLNASGSSFTYNMTLGGAQADNALALHLDASGNLIVGGQTSSSDFPVTSGALQSTLKGAQNLFIARLDPAGKTLYSTYVGGSGKDFLSSLQTDLAGNIYIAGQTNSLDFPTTAGSFEPTAIIPLWNVDAPAGIAAKLNPAATSIIWSTYVMSADGPNYITPVQAHEGVTQLAVSAAGDVYAALASGAGFPTTPSAPQSCFAGGSYNLVVAHLDAKGALADATYVGQNVNIASALSVGSGGQILLASIGVSRIRFAGTGYSPAACLSSAVLNSATFLQDRNIVPGELISLTGLGIGPETASTANVQVLFDGQPVPLLYAQSRQINVQAPVELAGKTQTSITVLYNNATVGTATATVDNYGAPGIFRFRPGLSADSAVINQDGTINGPQNPASKGSAIAMWGTGFGMITPPCSTGGLNPNAAVNLAPPLLVWFTDPGSPPTQPYAYPTYAGAAPGLLCGIVQINRVVPDYATSGAYSFTVLSLRQRPQGDAEAAFDTIPVKIYVK